MLKSETAAGLGLAMDPVVAASSCLQGSTMRLSVCLLDHIYVCMSMLELKKLMTKGTKSMCVCVDTNIFTCMWRVTRTHTNSYDASD